LICNNIEENKKYQNLKKVKLCEIKSNDSWARDTLPLKVNNKYIGFVFNGYNGVLQEYDLDAELGKNLCDKFNLPFKKCDLWIKKDKLCTFINNFLRLSTKYNFIKFFTN